MDLILWRHAEAEEGSDDFARELTEKGRRQAEKISAFLSPKLVQDAKILVSPAIRTQQTATFLGRDFTTSQNLAPGASVHAVLQAVRWPDGDSTVLVVGHQPTLGIVASTLLGCNQESLRIKKGALWWLSRRPGTTDTTLRLVISPDFL